MQQRVGLARAMAADPDILLLDEPFSALDPLIRRQLQDQFLNISKVQKKTTIFITHDLDEAIRIGDRIAIMKDGAVVQVGTPEDIVTNPKDAYVADFVAGISRLQLVTAGRIMTSGAQSAPILGDHRVRADTKIDQLIDLAIETDQPIVVVDDKNQPIGSVSKDTLLRGIQGSKEAAADIQVDSTDFEDQAPDPKTSTESAAAFAVQSPEFYREAFHKIAAGGVWVFSFNAAAALIGPVFLAPARALAVEYTHRFCRSLRRCSDCPGPIYQSRRRPIGARGLVKIAGGRACGTGGRGHRGWKRQPGGKSDQTQRTASCRCR